MPFGDRLQPRRHRRREQRRLAVLRCRFEDRVEIFRESHVEHLVGLVEDEHADAVEGERVAAHEIEHASRGADDDVGAALERPDLLHHRRAAVNGDDDDAGAARIFVGRFADLHGELTGWHEHKASRAPAEALLAGAGICLFGEPMDHRQRERGGLTGAGRGLGEEVGTGEDQRDRRALDGRRLLIAERLDRFDEGGARPREANPAAAEVVEAIPRLCLRRSSVVCPAPFAPLGQRGCRTVQWIS